MKTTRIVIIDVSSSMAWPFETNIGKFETPRVTEQDIKFQAAIEYLRYVISNIPKSNELILVAFSTTAEVVFRGNLKNISEIERSISKLVPNGISTNIEVAFKRVLDIMKGSPENKFHLLDIITDGLSNEGNPIPVARELQTDFSAMITIYLIDPIPEGLNVAENIAGEEGFGRIESITTKLQLLEKAADKMHYEAEMRNTMAKFDDEYKHEFMLFKHEVIGLEKPQFTAAFPESVEPLKWYPLDIFIYIQELHNAVLREIKKISLQEGKEYGQLSSKFLTTLKEGTTITISPSSDIIQVNPSSQSIQWYEKYYKLPFRIKYNAQNEEHKPAILSINIAADGLPIGFMQFTITPEFREEELKTATAHAQVFENVFASYSREDQKIVKHLKERYKALGIFMFIDIEQLRAGAMWQAKLYEKIAESDIFQLFWSNAASESKNVKKEYNVAIELTPVKGVGFIRPVFWEEPKPKIPIELSRINFYKLPFC